MYVNVNHGWRRRQKSFIVDWNEKKWFLKPRRIGGLEVKTRERFFNFLQVLSIEARQI